MSAMFDSPAALLRVAKIKSEFRWAATLSRGEPEIGGRQLADTLTGAYFRTEQPDDDVPAHASVFSSFGHLARYIRERFADFGSPLQHAGDASTPTKWVYDVVSSPHGRRPLISVGYRHGGPSLADTEVTRVFYGRAEAYDSAHLLHQAMRLDESSALVAEIQDEMLTASVPVLPFRALGGLAERVQIDVEDVMKEEAVISVSKFQNNDQDFGFIALRLQFFTDENNYNKQRQQKLVELHK